MKKKFVSEYLFSTITVFNILYIKYKKKQNKKMYKELQYLYNNIKIIKRKLKNNRSKEGTAIRTFVDFVTLQSDNTWPAKSM